MAIPDDRYYTAQHEWVEVITEGADGGADAGETVVRVGITDFAQDALGDIVFVQLPAEGDEVTGGSTLGEIESTKSVSDVYAPVSGTVRAANSDLEESPELVNSDCYGEGWLLEIAVSGDGEAAVDGLLDATAYQQVLETD